MIYVNVGALDHNGERIKTKTALKHLVKQDVDQSHLVNPSVAFDQTSYTHSGSVPGISTIEELPDGVVLSVVGPDPYSDRRWYATVERNGDKVTVK